MFTEKKRAIYFSMALIAAVYQLPSADAAPSSGNACINHNQAVIREGKGEIWRGSFERFAASHPDLSTEQQALVSEALKLSPSFGAVDNKASVSPELLRRTIGIVSRFRSILSNTQMGELFSAMGAMQMWLVESSVMAVPFCDCAGSGACGGGGQPSGTCSAGCLSWDGSNGTRYDGLCGTGAAE